MKKAKLTYGRQRFKEIYEIEGSGQRFMTGAQQEDVMCRKALPVDLIASLSRASGISFGWIQHLTGDQILLLAKKFIDEICQDDNLIAYDQCNNSGFMVFERIK